MTNDNWSFYEQHFSQPRLGHYLNASAGNHSGALALYRWNAAMSSAFWEALSYFEVAFRNAIDSRLCQRQRRLRHPTHWVFDDMAELGRDLSATGRHRHSQPYADIDAAKQRVRRNAKQLTASQIISELPFGFWHQLVSKKQMFLWPDLASAFPGAPDRNQATIHDRMRRPRVFRNRIGHHHRIWSADVAGRYGDLLDLAGFLDTPLRKFIHEHTRVAQMLDSLPPRS